MFFDILGWMGMILILLSYILLSANKIGNGMLYQILNLVAAILMAIGLLPTKAWFSFTLEIVWAIIAIISIVGIFKNKKK